MGDFPSYCFYGLVGPISRGSIKRALNYLDISDITSASCSFKRGFRPLFLCKAASILASEMLLILYLARPTFPTGLSPCQGSGAGILYTAVTIEQKKKRRGGGGMAGGESIYDI